MLAAQCIPHSHGVRLRAVATPRVHAVTLRKSCVAHGKITAAQLREREAVQARQSVFGTPVVDYLLETSPYARFLDGPAIASIRDREKSLAEANVAEKLRRLRIAFANKGRKPWNVGKHHNDATIEKIRKGVARAMQDPAVIDKLRKNYVAQTPETRVKMKEAIKLRYGIQLHKTAFGQRSKNCNSVATTGAAVFHCHVGCSALVGFRRVGWRRNTVFEKRAPKRKFRRKMTEEELEASRQRARQRVAEAMKKKWQDPEYRAKQTEAIRISHAENPRTPAPRTHKQQAKRSSKPRRSQQSTLSKRLASQARDLQATLQELQETRAYHAKFEGVVSKLHAQEEALSTQPDAQQQVHQALAGVLVSQDKAQGSITALENKVDKLQQQLESTELALAKEQQLQAEASRQADASPRTTDEGVSSSVKTTGSVPETVAQASRAEPADFRDQVGTASTPEQTRARAAVAGGAGAPSSADAAQQGAGAGNAGVHDGNSSSSPRSGASSHAAPSGMVAAPAAASANGAVQNGAAAGVGHDGAPHVTVGNGTAAADGGACEGPAAEGPGSWNGSGAHANGNGNVHGNGVHDTGAASLNGGSRPRMGSGEGYLRDEVDLGRAAGIADGGAAMSIPTAAEWKGRRFDTSHNGHVVTHAVALGSSVGCSEESPDAAGTRGAVLVKPPPSGTNGTRVAHRLQYDTPEEGRHAAGGVAHSGGSHSLGQDDAKGEEVQEDEESLNWLQKRAHKLPWQE